ncbi:hypothetical protein AVEN_104553-1 [Araneus ventricosus]|uniref:Uncharacterized protein n=1 Tax=Araneus ventricosus TaxID=182803 RepID=A0A4Y2W2N1_ARAVE|nr:hypothetical protein AVEN_104553-1 [Araneus ventricosus]
MFKKSAAVCKFRKNNFLAVLDKAFSYQVHVFECLCKVGVLPVIEDDAGVEQVARALDVDAGAVHVTPVRAPQLAQAPQQDLEQERQNGQSSTPCGVVFLKHR